MFTWRQFGGSGILRSYFDNGCRISFDRGQKSFLVRIVILVGITRSRLWSEDDWGKLKLFGGKLFEGKITNDFGNLAPFVANHVEGEPATQVDYGKAEIGDRVLRRKQLNTITLSLESVKFNLTNYRIFVLFFFN